MKFNFISDGEHFQQLCSAVYDDLNNFWVAALCGISCIIPSIHTSKGAICVHVGFCLLVDQMGE